MLASVRLQLPDDATVTLYAGDIIGRTWTAALHIDDPDVSEAHAMVSLRGERLWLLALRRRFTVAGKTVDAVPLVEGTRIWLAPGWELRVGAVHLPAHIMGLEGPGLPAQVLPGTCSLVRDPQPRLTPGRVADAIAVFWLTDDTWRVRAGDHNLALTLGMHLPNAPEFQAVPIAIAAAGQTPTRADLSVPLRIVCSFDTVQIHRDAVVTVLGGQYARVISELASVGQPVPWDELARPLWRHIEERDLLRRRWDGLLTRLRDRLRDEGLRTDLVSSSRVGLVELVLRADDQLIDKA